MLDQINEVITSIQHLHQKLNHFDLWNAEGALFESYMDQHEGECYPGTRTELLKQIHDWGSSPQRQCIFWLHGKAGTGKLTISQTMVRMFKEHGQLRASFFFKRGEGDCGNVKRFFSTITRQLITAIPQLTPDVSNTIDEDPDISTKSLKSQFDKLIFQPLCKLNQA